MTSYASSYPALSLYIDGEFIEAADRQCQEVRDPATFEVLGSLPHASAVDMDCSIAAAQRAFGEWRHTSPVDRGQVLRKAAVLMRERAAEIAKGITLDNGKPLAEALGEVAGSAEQCDWHAEECRRIYGRVVPPRNPAVRQLVVREPVGVCAAFSPWNFPLNQAVRKVAAALGAGCTLILKGPEESPSAVVALARIFHDAGLPPGVLNIVWGVPSEVSHHLITSPIVRKISFTGSVPVGKQLAALVGLHMKRMTMELGGHSPVIVCDDADLDSAAEMLARFKVRNAGQVCISPSRFYVQQSVFDRFSKRFTEVMASTQLGHGLDEGTQMGPLANGRRLQAMQGFVADARARGGKVLAGGRAPASEGNFFEPTIITGLPDDALLMTEEPFGPVVPLTSFSTVDEAIARANSLPFGLASYVFTQSIKHATRISNGLEAGMVNINHFGMAPPELPFGGVKDSGIGSEGGCETFDGYLVTKMITQV